MGKISVIGDVDTISGFRLAGVKNSYAVKDAKEAEKYLLELSKNPEIVVVVLTERLAKELSPVIEKITELSEYPLILTIPDKKGPIEQGVDPMVQLIKRTIGVEVKVG